MFIVSIVLLSLSISGYGRIVNLDIKKNFFLDIFLGLIVISLIVTFIHFFLKINLQISFSIFTFGILIFFYKRNFRLFDLIKSENIYYILIIFLLIHPFFFHKNIMRILVIIIFLMQSVLLKKKLFLGLQILINLMFIIQFG